MTGTAVGRTDAFIGRQQVFDDVHTTLERRQGHVVLQGQKWVGKTSILHQLLDELPKRGQFVVASLDAQKISGWSLGRFVKELAGKIASALALPSPAAFGADPRGAFVDWLDSALNRLPPRQILVIAVDELDMLALAAADQSGPGGQRRTHELIQYFRELVEKENDRVRFLFVVGGHVEDLDQFDFGFLHVATPISVPLLDEEEVRELTQLSDASLSWDRSAIERIWSLAHGHPYLTQQLCAVVWDTLRKEGGAASSTALGRDVDDAVARTLEMSGRTLESLWDSLPAVSRVIAAAIAECGPLDVVSNGAWLAKLAQKGASAATRELDHGVELLRKAEVIERGYNYAFRVELIRMWFATNRPLGSVSDELDDVGSRADQYYQLAYKNFRDGEMAACLHDLKKATEFAPRHPLAHELRGIVYLEGGAFDEAIAAFERFYEVRPEAATLRLVDAFLRKANASSDLKVKIDCYSEMLRYDKDNAAAHDGRRSAWIATAEASVRKGNLAAAEMAYRSAGAIAEAEACALQAKRARLEYELNEAQRLLDAGDGDAALEVLTPLRDDLREPMDPQLQRLNSMTDAAQIKSRLKAARAHLAHKKVEKAIPPLAKVLSVEPLNLDARTMLAAALGAPRVRSMQPILPVLAAVALIFGLGVAVAKSNGAAATIIRDGAVLGTASLKDAVDNAKAGDTILVHPGSHRGPFVVAKEISLIGAGARDEVVLSAFDASVLTVTSTARISNLKLQAEPGQSALAIRAGRPVVERCELVAAGGVGAQVSGDSAPILRSNEVRGAVTGVVVRDNAGGLYEDNDIVESREYGIHLKDWAAPSISNNHILASAHAAIVLDQDASVSISGNELYGGNRCIEARAGSATIRGNRIRDCELFAFSIGGTAQVNHSDNEILSGSAAWFISSGHERIGYDVVPKRGSVLAP